MAAVNLHELANTPGAGKAREALRKAGLWQESHDDLPRWEVEIEATRSCTAIAIIAAPDAETARKAAHKVDTSDLDFEDDYYSLEIEGAGSVKPAQRGDEPDLIVRERLP